jgi:ABC-2 type transport system ATP-binding protein
MSMILEMQEVSKKYPKSNFRLNDVSFSIPGGAIMGFVGENGAGKTTTIGCILNTLIKDSGVVKIFGKEMSDESIDIRDDIGAIFDTNSFPEYMTAAKISSAMRYIYSNWDNELFKDYLHKWGLPEKKEIKTFSRGMAMKLGVAAALSHRPKFLILDEAMSGLDPIARDELLDLLLHFARDENHAVFLSSHITTDLEKVADYITFIHNGSIILSKKKEELICDYGVMRCNLAQFSEIDKQDILAYSKQGYQVNVLISDKSVAEKKYCDIPIDSTAIEEIMLMFVKGKNNAIE